MRSRVMLVVIGLALAIGAAPAAAQQRARTAGGRVPESDMGGIGISFGAAVPRDASLDNGPIVAGTLERYVTPRVSFRAEVARAWLDVIPRPGSKVNPLFVDGNIVYNWEGGAIHPYVTGGLGLYHYSFDIPGVNGSSNEFGADLGGGAEYFFSRRVTMTFELLFHVANSPTVVPGAAFNSRFWNFSVGAKRYF